MTVSRRRCSRSEIYNYVLHLCLRNGEIQQKRRSFRLSDTRYTDFGISPQEATHVLKDLSLVGVFTRNERHPRRWSITESFRQRLIDIRYGQLELIAEKLSDLFRQNLILTLSKTKVMDEPIAETLGLKAVYEEA